MKKAQDEGLLIGLIPHIVDKGVVNLQYVDDTVFLLHDDLEMARNLKCILIYLNKCLG